MKVSDVLGNIGAIALYLSKKTGQDYSYWKERGERIQSEYKRLILEAGYNRYDPAGDVSIVEPIHNNTGIDVDEIALWLTEVHARAKSGDVPLDMWGPRPGVVERMSEVTAEPVKKLATGTLIIAAVLAGLYVLTLIQAPKIRPISPV